MFVMDTTYQVSRRERPRSSSPPLDRRTPNKRKKQREKRNSSLDRNALKGQTCRALQQSKSMSNLFHKSSPSKKSESKIELSTVECAPGVLKIFGDLVQSGTRYKSVLATLSSTAEELVKDALERYNIHTGLAGQYMLCDVIGFVKTEGKDGAQSQVWIEACARVVDDSEKPLTLQAFWKPADTFSRRFELRKRRVSNDFSNGVRGRLRKSYFGEPCTVLPMSASLPSGEDVSNPSFCQSSINEGRRESFVAGHCLQNSPNGVTAQAEPPQRSKSYSGRPSQLTGYTSRLAKIKSLHGYTSSNSKGHVSVPENDPYLINIQSFEQSSDAVVYVIHEKELRIGSQKNAEGDNLYLSAPDILESHCMIFRSERTREERDRAWCTLEPFPQACVKVNGEPVIKRTSLKNGDFISFGDHYIYLFRQPKTGSDTEPGVENTGQQLSRLQILTNTSPSTNPDQTQITDGLIGDNNKIITPFAFTRKIQESTEVLAWRRKINEIYETDHSRLKLPYLKDTLVTIVQKVVDRVDGPSADLYPLTASYIFCMMVEYSAVKYDQLFARQVIRYISQTARTSLWNKSRLLIARQSERPRNVNTAIDALLPDMQPVVGWLSNNLELLNYFRENLCNYLLDPAISLPADLRETMSSTAHEAEAVLEEAVMYGFQQTVYNLTKTLYASLPAIMESNPFVEEDNLSSCSLSCDYDNPTVDTVLSVYQSTLVMLHSQQLHPHLISQVFCYLFYFTSTSVFNSLMNAEAAVRYFKWSRGAQLRGNLDAVEAWAAGNNLRHEVLTHLRKINCLADLLATPKVQLLQSDWRSLRHDFAALTPSQLHHVLSGYQLGTGCQKPQTWLPTPEDVHLISADRLLESYTDHPTLLIPKEGSAVNLNRDVKDQAFHDLLADLKREFDERDDDGDSGLSVSQHYSSANDATLDTDCYSECAIDVPDALLTSNNSAASSVFLQTSGTATSHFTQSTDDSIQSKPSPNDGTHPSRSSRCPGGQLSSFQIQDTCDENQRMIQNWSETRRLSCELKIDDQRRVSIGLCTEATSKNAPPICTPRRKKEQAPVEREHSLTFSVEEYNLYKDHIYVNVPMDHQDFSGNAERGYATEEYGIGVEQGRVVQALDFSSHQFSAVPRPPPRKSRAGKRSSKQASLLKSPSHTNTIPQEGTTLEESKITLKHASPKQVCDPNEMAVQRDALGRTPSGSRVSLGSPFIPLVMKGTMEHLGYPIHEEETPDTIEVVLTKGPRGLGLGLIDGLYTPLQAAGIYVRTLVPGEPAARDGRLALGDRILAVNEHSVLGADYQRAMNLVRKGGDTLTFVVEKSSMSTAMHITASNC